MNKVERLLAVISLAGYILMGCSSTPTEPFNNQVETLVALTLAVYTPDAPPAVFTSIPTLTYEPATSEPFGEIYVFTTAQNVNLRTNPGTLFSVSRVMPQNTRLRLLGQAPGGEWLNVRNDEGIEGWVSSSVVLMAYDSGPPPPVIEPSDVYVVTGSVFTETNTPVTGIGFAIYQAERRTDTHTDANGQFHAYLPRTLSGIWQVGYVSISCTSNTMDSDCNCISGKCGSPNPESEFVELPQIHPISFVWK